MLSSSFYQPIPYIGSDIPYFYFQQPYSELN